MCSSCWALSESLVMTLVFIHQSIPSHIELLLHGLQVNSLQKKLCERNVILWLIRIDARESISHSLLLLNGKCFVLLWDCAWISVNQQLSFPRLQLPLGKHHVFYYSYITYKVLLTKLQQQYVSHVHISTHTYTRVQIINCWQFWYRFVLLTLQEHKNMHREMWESSMGK